MYYISQIQKDDCGFACLKIVLANLNKDKNYLFLPQDEKHGYYSFSDLKRIGERHGLTFKAVRATERESIMKETKFPLIVVTLAKNGAKHAVVVTKAKGKRISYIDPKIGTINTSLNVFLGIWDGTALIIENFRKTKCGEVMVEPIKKSTHFGLTLLQMMVGVLAVIGVYFIKDGTPIYYPVIFFGLAILLELFLKMMIYHVMKKLDSYFFREDNLPSSGYKDYLYRYENYKRLALSSPMNYVLILVFTLALVVVSLLNDMRNILLIFVPILLCFTRHLYVKPVLKRKRSQIAELEENLDNIKNVQALKQTVKTIHDKAYLYGYLDMVCRYVFIGIIIAVTLLLMNLNGISSVPYLVFYSYLTIVFYRSIDQLFSFEEKMEEFNIVKVRINNSMNHVRK